MVPMRIAFLKLNTYMWALTWREMRTPFFTEDSLESSCHIYTWNVCLNPTTSRSKPFPCSSPTPYTGGTVKVVCMLVAQSKILVETVRKFSTNEIQQNEKNGPFFRVAIFINSSAKNSKQKKAPPTTTLTNKRQNTRITDISAISCYDEKSVPKFQRVIGLHVQKASHFPAVAANSSVT